MSENFVQKFVDILRGKIKIKISMEKNPLFDAKYRDELDGCLIPYMKKCKIEEIAPDIKTLILGNSHGVYGYIPDKEEFNFCMPSQDLYYSLQLYEKYRFACSNLDTVILFYSVFSPGFEVHKTSEKYRCVWYGKFFGIACTDMESEKIFQKIIKKLKCKTDKFCKSIEIPDNYRGENINSAEMLINQDNIEDAVRKRALSHFKNNIRSNNSDKYLIELSEKVKQDNHRLIVVVAPMREDYRYWLASDEVLFRDLYKISKDKQFKVLNFYGDKSFTNEDFFDYDHLNTAGADKLTKMIKESIRK